MLARGSLRMWARPRPAAVLLPSNICRGAASETPRNQQQHSQQKPRHGDKKVDTPDFQSRWGTPPGYHRDHVLQINSWAKAMGLQFNPEGGPVRDKVAGEEMGFNANYVKCHAVHRYDHPFLLEIHALNPKFKNKYEIMDKNPLWCHIYEYTPTSQSAVVRKTANKLCRQAFREALADRHYDKRGVALDESTRGTEVFGTVRFKIYDAKKLCEARFSRERWSSLVAAMSRMLDKMLPDMRRKLKSAPKPGKKLSAGPQGSQLAKEDEFQW